MVNQHNWGLKYLTIVLETQKQLQSFSQVLIWQIVIVVKLFYMNPLLTPIIMYHSNNCEIS